jgi:hypothetical protein
MSVERRALDCQLESTTISLTWGSNITAEWDRQCNERASDVEIDARPYRWANEPSGAARSTGSVVWSRKAGQGDRRRSGQRKKSSVRSAEFHQLWSDARP